ncbi:WD40 repeat domain-containing protein [Nonomuraea sp. NPDC046802]|uniref:WD40 repeat domain-containing protein n=1 Tax=Nonomuraea sp. NPDC046802 TaxID=3154919 RepID=UPI0033DBD21D
MFSATQLDAFSSSSRVRRLSFTLNRLKCPSSDDLRRYLRAMLSQSAILSSEVPSSQWITDFTFVETAAGPLVVCLTHGGVWTWDPLRDVWQERPLTFACAGDPLNAPYPDAENDLGSVAAVVSDGRVVLAAGGDEQGFAFWDLESGKLIREATYADPYLAAMTEVRGEGSPLFVTATQYAEQILVWRPSAKDALLELPNDLGLIAGLTAVQGHGLSRAAAGGRDGDVSVWDLKLGERIASFGTEEGCVEAVSLTRLASNPIVVAAVEHEIYVWDLTRDSDDPIHDPWEGHDETVLTLDTVTFDDRTLAVTGGEDGAVCIWDLRTGTQIGNPLIGHDRSVETVRTAVINGRHVALSAGRDEKINVWDLQA